MSLEPANKGRRETISAKIQPTDHFYELIKTNTMSIGVE
jgi:hypothetical protein